MTFVTINFPYFHTQKYSLSINGKRYLPLSHLNIDKSVNILLFSIRFLSISAFISFIFSIFTPNKAIQSWQN